MGGGRVWPRAVVGLLVVAVLAGPSVAADAVPWDARTGAMLARAEQWYRAQPVYSQDQCFQAGGGYAGSNWAGVLGGCHRPHYRTDCSGFVSMVWGLPYSYATPRPGLETDLTDVSRVITKDQLRAGDALLAYGQHVRLFEKWLDPAHTRYLAYDFGATPVKHQAYPWAGADEYDYVPIRYQPAA